MEIKIKIKDVTKLRKGDLLIWDGEAFVPISTFDLLRPIKELIEANQEKEIIFRSQTNIVLDEIKKTINEQRKEIAEILKGLVE
jgi:hypothetical protein